MPRIRAAPQDEAGGDCQSAASQLSSSRLDAWPWPLHRVQVGAKEALRRRDVGRARIALDFRSPLG